MRFWLVYAGGKGRSVGLFAKWFGAKPKIEVNGIDLELALIPAGSFDMGSPKGEPERLAGERLHTVNLTKPFWIGVTLVTQRQWKRLLGATAANPSKFRGDDLPVERVTWEEAAAFCEKLGQREKRVYRLPTEAEWEYACRAGTGTPFSCGPTITTDLANYLGTHRYEGGAVGENRQTTTPVKTFKPNPWGLYDMHGNLWEWCSDWYAEYGPGPDTDPKGPPKGDKRVCRGGSWMHTPRRARSACRSMEDPTVKEQSIGFRVVCEA